MSARRVSEKTFEMPANPHFLEFERSDGDSSRWPTSTTRIVDKDGEVNFMSHLPLDHPQSIRWRLGVAQGIAAACNMPANSSYALRDWPAGYSFYDHHKGLASNPRHDLYLYGGSARRYRSINELIPHAIWLYQDTTQDPSNCLCKYCQKKPQKEVTASFSPGILRTTHSTPTPSRTKPGRPKTLREPVVKAPREKVYAAVQKAPIPAVSKSSNVHSKATMLVERNSDLRAMSSKTAMKLRRWFRAGELLWCALDPPISGPDGVTIQFWPGLVDEARLKTKSIPRETPLASQLPPGKGQDHEMVSDDAEDAVPWNVSQSTQYRTQLLAVNHTYVISDDRVLPYQAHVPSNELIYALKAFPTAKLNFDREFLTRFNPCPKDGIVSFEDAVAPYAMALQIGATLSSSWCLTDEWAFEYRRPADIPPPLSPSHSNSASTTSGSLPATISAASLRNTYINDSASSGPSHDSYQEYYPEPKLSNKVSIANPDMSQTEAQRISARILGKVPSPPSPNSPPRSQMRFQGLWWGAERIWTDEFVRLKVPRRCIAPKGAENILPPAGPGKAMHDMWLKKGRDPSELGAGTRGVFMRLDGLFVVDARQSDGVSIKKECRASGMLYELVDIDWEDPNAIASSSSSNKDTAPLSFVLAPSPLNPHVPPKQSDALTPPVAPTAQPPYIPNPPLPTSQLSHPSPMYYTLPEAPEGYTFRPILPEGYEVIVSLSLISGRYYPRILSHPLLEPTLEVALAHPKENGGLTESNNLWALEGLSAGFYNSVDPIQYKASRMKMVQDADTTAERELETHKQDRLREADENINEDVDELGYPDTMDVDP